MNPIGWVEARLDEFGEIFCGQSPTAKDVNQDGRGIAYVTGPEQWDGSSVLQTKWTTDPRRVVPDGCVFITVKGAGVGTLFHGIPCAIGRDVYAYKPIGGIDQSFVFYALRQTISQVVREARGDIPGLSKDHLLKHTIGIPPSNEQHRIVAKLEELFSELDAGVAALRRAQRRLARYRQSLLQAAVTGELTREWRESHTHDIKLGKLASMPTGWTRPPFETLISRIEAGKNFTAKGVPPSEGETGIVKISAVTWSTYDENESKTVPRADLVNSKLFIRPGDFLFSRANTLELVGACVIVHQVTKPIMLSDKILRIHFKDESMKPWVLVFLRSGAGRRELESRASGNQLSMRNIAQAKLNTVPIPTPPAEERQQILAELDRRLSAADALDATFQTSLRRAERLRQSILARAFCGELVPQDPSDQSAADLLRQIKQLNNYPSGQPVSTRRGYDRMSKKTPGGAR